MKKLVVLSGAGISAESGLKTFRDTDGLWEGYDIEEVATPRAWKRNPQLVLEFYNLRRQQVRQAQPNKAHKLLAELEAVADVQIITQNIDDLHERAGSTRVLHLHGEIFSQCSEFDRGIIARIEDDMEYGALAPDGGQWRPDIVWFGEAVPAIAEAVPFVQEADLFLVIGTSLVVYPAASLVDYVKRSAPLFVIDKRLPDMRIDRPITSLEYPAGEGMERLIEILKRDHF